MCIYIYIYLFTYIYIYIFVAHLVCTALTDAIPAYFTWCHGGFTWENVLNLRIAPDRTCDLTAHFLHPDFNPSYNLGCRWIWSLWTSGSENQIIGNLLVMIIPFKIFIIVFSIFYVGKFLGGGLQVFFCCIVYTVYLVPHFTLEPWRWLPGTGRGIEQQRHTKDVGGLPNGPLQWELQCNCR